MKTIPQIGARVRYSRPASEHIEARSCVGTVVAIYRGGDKHTDPETGKDFITPDHVAIQVDKPLPGWWPYNGTDRFAPEVSEVELDKHEVAFCFPGSDKPTKG